MIDDLDIEWEAKMLKNAIKEASKNIKHFIPEYDGMNLLKAMLPIEEAMQAGKESKLYNTINEIYGIVKRNLMSTPTIGIWEGGVIGFSQRTPNLDSYDNLRDRTSEGKLIPYKGLFGICKAVNENKE